MYFSLPWQNKTEIKETNPDQGYVLEQCGSSVGILN